MGVDTGAHALTTMADTITRESRDFPAPRAGWALRPSLSDDYPDEVVTGAQARLYERLAQRRDLMDFLGAVFVDTTMLPLPNGAMLGPSVDREGRERRFSLWAPRHRLLLDIFKRVRLPDAELEDRQAFADAHALRYAIVEPGMRLTIDALKDFLAPPESVAAAGAHDA